MIDPKEFRIGNLVCIAHESDGPIAIVTQVRQHGAMAVICGSENYHEAEFLLPIPLAPEWLERMGFIRDRNGWYIKGAKFSLTDQFFPCWLDRMLWPQDIPDFRRLSIEHVHQLQNLYFALTGEEIKIKELA